MIDHNILKHLYISPLEQCNLNCRMCYTQKTKERLDKESILKFITRYGQEMDLQTITFCGGEVFLMTGITELINQLTPKYFVQIITNASLDKLDQLETPNQVNLIVSIDGRETYHNLNRGTNRWRQAVNFLKKAHSLGFHTEVFSVVTQENYPEIDTFEIELEKILGYQVEITYHPRKPKEYLERHPWSNLEETTKGFGFLTPDDRMNLAKKRRIFPPITFNCYQISLMSDGRIYGCCEGYTPLGDLNTTIKTLINNLESREDYGCVEPGFRCGL